MENEELFIREKAGTDNPFRVPEGYFDQLTARVMAQLPEQPRQQSRTVPLRRWLYAAACVAFAAVMGLTYHFHQTGSDEQPLATNTESSYIEEAADYAMLDNAEIYACLADY
ncbi:MAG: hypothetical protein II822_02720 [Prevotella sp.]|nr:hypothetical protein [Prevotella sp.]